jgi:SAM-dependent methyltransferase
VTDRAPSPFILEHAALAPAGPVLDVACGSGRHALALARTMGRAVDAIDRDRERCARLATVARAEGLPVRVVCADLEHLPLPAGRYAMVVDSLYLDRALVPALIAALRPGGLLLFETFVFEQLATGHPRNPAFVLGPNELLELAAGLRVLAYREGPADRDGRQVHLASLAARTPEPLEGTERGE